MKIFLVFVFLGSVLCAANEFDQVECRYIDNPNDPCHRIEFFTLKPKGVGPFPVLFVLHGHQPPETSNGGEQLVKLGYLDMLVQEGIVAVAISIPGFGNSGGSRDFSGPNSQKAIATVVEYFKQFPYIDSAKMGIYGISKGAILASMVHKYTSSLNLQILEAGTYDLSARNFLLPSYLSGIQKNLIAESGGTDRDFMERSALFNTEYIHANTLILAGEFDDRRTVPSSVALHEKLLAEKKTSRIKIFPDELHVLSAVKWKTILPFLRQQFFDLYGIGIHVTLVMPAIQLAHILPNSPAAQSGKLHIGDVILKISPNNDGHEIDTLRMPVAAFISHLLGKRGTELCLYVQHFDQTCEEVVLKRGSIEK